jgi:hypothetical protein
VKVGCPETITTANFGAAVSSDDAAMQLHCRANRENRSVVRGGGERFEERLVSSGGLTQILANDAQLRGGR